jgi:hypothetical protein
MRYAWPLAAGLVLMVLAGVRGTADARLHARGADAPAWTERARLDALRRAVVWRPPAVPIEKADLAATPDALPDEVTCRFHVDDLNGLTPKFECELRGGEVIKVKYAGVERYGEVAASRLLRALGFGADNVSFARRVRCYGCPRFPFTTMKVVSLAGAERLFEKGLDYDSAMDFEWAAVERKSRLESIETPEVRGWAFHELARVPTASRAHADALTLMAVFLAHWDNKAENQRLQCLSGGPGRDGACARPFAMLQDVGGTFGPRKVELDAWKAAPLWEDRAQCRVTMASLPHGGATFTPVGISEAGRQFLASRLSRLRDAQIEALFRGARFEHHNGTVEGWVAAFKQRVAAIADGPRCPK